MSEPLPDRAPDIRATAMAADANPYGTIFVGWLMGQMALAAGALASRHCRGRAPVVAADGFAFAAPVVVGDEVSFYASLVTQGRSSMTIAVDVWRRERHGEATERAATGSFTLVAMTADGRPRPVDGEDRVDGNVETPHAPSPSRGEGFDEDGASLG